MIWLHFSILPDLVPKKLKYQTIFSLGGSDGSYHLLRNYYYYYYYYYFGITSPLRDEKNALTTESYPLSEMSRTLLRMKAVPSNAAFCKQLITMGILMVFRRFSSSSLTVSKAPTTIGITLALTSRNRCTCNLKSWYLF